MNKREQNRVEKYLITYPNIKNNPEALEQLKQLCLDPSIGYPCNATNQKMFRQARKKRDELVDQLAKSL